MPCEERLSFTPEQLTLQVREVIYGAWFINRSSREFEFKITRGGFNGWRNFRDLFETWQQRGIVHWFIPKDPPGPSVEDGRQWLIGVLREMVQTTEVNLADIKRIRELNHITADEVFGGR